MGFFGGMNMWFTKNEKKVLKLLLENSRLSDKIMSQKLGITSQAVGRIRKHLEKTIIKKYSIELDLKKLGINLFETRKFKIIPNETYPNINKFEEEITKIPHCYFLARTTEGINTYLACLAFANMDEFQELIREQKNKSEVAKGMEMEKPTFFLTDEILKLSLRDIILKSLDKERNKNKKFDNRIG